MSSPGVPGALVFGPEGGSDPQFRLVLVLANDLPLSTSSFTLTTEPEIKHAFILLVV
jgi:hypothetical protein